MSTETTQSTLKDLEELSAGREKILAEVRKVIVGQDAVIEELLMALFASGHCLLVGVPGLAKTLLISTLARVLDLKFNRIQFTPDLMPSDITGTEILEEDRATGRREFQFVQGPIFANMVLADEVNRTPPKTQAALLQAMQEHEVTAGGRTFHLELPFFVLATQNPIELEGTYPLPEAQLDRFMFNVRVGYPSEAEECRIVTNTTSAYQADVKTVLRGADVLHFQKLVRRIPVSDYVVNYAVRLARATRPASDGKTGVGVAGTSSLDFVTRWVSWGAGPRASQYLILGAKTRAALHGTPAPSCEDVRRVAKPVLRHRIVTNFNAEAEGVKTEEIIERLLDTVPEGEK
jgi:MoxR-like ATPase